MNVNDALLGRSKRGGKDGSAAKRKRSNKNLNADDVAKKSRTSTMSSWLSPVVGTLRTKGIKSTITPEAKVAAVHSKTHALTPSSKVRPATTQSYIDVGQRSFGKHITCSTCGLLYTVGEEEDEREHEKFCRQKQRGVAFSKWKNERLLKKYSDTGARVIEIRGGDPSAHVKKLMEVKAVLDDALGFVENQAFLHRSIFVYIQEHQVVGCVTTERISEAFTLDTSGSQLVAESSAKEKEGDVTADGAVTVSTDSRPAVVGICQIWVHPSFRRRGIATRMVDVVREKSIYGMHVAKNLVAFAQPTRNGLQFAQKYMEPSEVLMY